MRAHHLRREIHWNSLILKEIIVEVDRYIAETGVGLQDWTAKNC